jgi:hypothetical protein
MITNNLLQAKLTTVATFPKNYFLENLVVRSDNSILITALNHKELWYVPPSRHDSPVEPLPLIHGFSTGNRDCRGRTECFLHFDF